MSCPEAEAGDGVGEEEEEEEFEEEEDVDEAYVDKLPRFIRLVAHCPAWAQRLETLDATLTSSSP